MGISRMLRGVRSIDSKISQALMSGRTNWNTQSIAEIDISAVSAEVMLQWSNLILKMRLNEEDLFFRFCAPHFPICSYVRNFFDVFVLRCKTSDFDEEECTDEKIKDFIACINCWLENEKNVRKILLNLPNNLLKLNKTVWGNEQITLSESELKNLGMPDLPLELEVFLPLFVKFLLVLVSTYRKNRFVTRNVYESGNYTKFRASYELANALGIDWIVSRPFLAKVKIGNTYYEGFICKSTGLPATKIIKNITGELQRQLSILNMFDVLTGERDHGPNNYSLLWSKQERKIKVCCFDNDGDDTFTISTGINCMRAFGSAPIEKGGKINRVFLDKEFAEKLFDFRFSDMVFVLGQFLNFIQIIAAFRRLQKLRRAIYVTEQRRVLLIDSTSWNINSAKRELNSVNSYGKSYLNIYDEKCKMVN